MCRWTPEIHVRAAILLAKASACCLPLIAPSAAPAQYSATFYVAPEGSDGNPGTIGSPLRTLEAARQKVRDHKTAHGVGPGGIAVFLREGDWLLSSGFALSSQDSGVADRPVVWRAQPGETVRLLGAESVDGAWFSPVTSGDPEWNRLPAEARGQVLRADLAAHGITDYGQLLYRGNGDRVLGALELFADERPMQLARWPDADQHEPQSTHEDDQVRLFGTAVPDVSGTWNKAGTRDGVNYYVRDGLVNGQTYFLYRHSWIYDGNPYTAWFIAAQDAGYPGNTHPWWYRYAQDLGSFGPADGAGQGGAAGTATTVDPSAVLWGFAAIDQALSDTRFTVQTDRMSRWSAATDPWFFGFWKHYWAEKHVAAASIDAANKTVTLSRVPGYGIAPGMPWLAENLLEEISQPGEWYLERSSGVLFWWPTANVADLEIMVSMLEEPVLRVEGAEHLQFRDLSIGMGRSDAVAVTGGSHVTFDRCRLFGAGQDGARIQGSNHTVQRSEVVDTGDHGIRLEGGDRPSLTPGNNRVENTDIHRFGRWTWSYLPGIHLLGSGNVARHNHIHDAPHSAILFRGNDHLIEYNEIDDVCLFSSDAGAIYAGRRWDWRGNRLAFNYIHDIDGVFPGAGEHAIYLDDCMAGVEVFGNLIVDVSGHAIMHGGGRDDLFENNIAVRCGTMLHSDSRGVDWITNDNSSWDLRRRMHDEGVDHAAEPWCSTWPELCAIPYADVPAGSHWRLPEDSVFSRNLGWDNSRFTVDSEWGGPAFPQFAEMANNLEDTDPRFVDEATGDYRLQPDSPALGIPGFVDLPFELMGILDGIGGEIFQDDFESGDTTAWK